MNDANRTHKQFSVTRLSISAVLIMAGVACYAYFKAHMNDAPTSFGVMMPLTLWFGGGASIGAGVTNLFRRPWLGVAVGVLIAAVAFGFLIFTAPLQS